MAALLRLMIQKMFEFLFEISLLQKNRLILLSIQKFF